MSLYKLLKDTPTIKAGTIFEEVISDYDELKELVRITPIGAKTSPQFTIQDIDNFDEWFEEIKEESTDSIHWKPKEGDNYFYIVHSYNPLHNEILVSTWIDDGYDRTHYLLGNIYRSYEEAEKARDRKLAEAKLRRMSNFKPDLKNGNSGWVVGYDHSDGEFSTECIPFCDYGEIVRYETKAEAEKSIKENKKDWKIYFGIKEEE